MSLVLSPVEGLQYWFMLPIAVLIATTAMASGVGGATFFFTALHFGPGPHARGRHRHRADHRGLWPVAQQCRFASGLYAYARKRLIDYRLSLALLTDP